ncbi:MAG: hypothetical protein UR50_C0002G0014 [Parcubacteria group bacterium GW2011_GWC1_34_10]|uniref:30S ribosomal protein S21 n=1 Tax=Candidatus Zambryskibacteria bacterium RIFCSPLOWO2_01_FULL_35_19 TaxID=1802757 RepID=A0A1G2TVR1_9BACT|nr:MAG: hypothetical protein UR50_C0002G0014 [Parcubacteria group bacterium GW2011_GWC1_34_10]OHA87620.1 MAG: hypothetical protein A2726_01885 [Candidatus Zambryskibacteria bacterium RIFCSPHIGHO2_01_FULL_35_32]OHB01253.1 MAG: hypothetical protein A3A90_00185 [Candidatus Zambryskibacteria bacterium RIFCSPLOWO2_01_FULL_35_19]
MAVNVEIVKSEKDNNLSVIRKFTKRVRGSGILTRLRSRRYSTRNISDYVKKKMTLKKLSQKAKIQELIKMGKMTDKLQ